MQWLKAISVALVFGATVIPTQSAGAGRPANSRAGPNCEGAPAGIGENMPFNTTDTAHGITSVAAVAVDGVRVGWIFGDRNGTRWLLRTSDPAVSEALLRRFERAFGSAASPPESLRGFAGPIERGLDIAAFAAHRVLVQGCR